MLRQIDLCSGIGAGFPLAGIITGEIKLCGLCESDEFCCHRLSDHLRWAPMCHRFPGVTIYPDVKELWIKPNYADLITSSPPCQPFTVEGKRLGSTDKRDCIPAVLRIVRIAQPKFFCLENVPGLLSAPIIPGAESGSYFQQMLKELWSSGYNAQWIVIGTQQFGSLWSGERLLLIATSRSLKLEWERTTPWNDQIGSQSQETGNSSEEGSIQSRMVGSSVRITNRMDRPPGVPSGNGIVRARRAALGNILDPRIAAIPLSGVGKAIA